MSPGKNPGVKVHRAAAAGIPARTGACRIGAPSEACQIVGAVPGTSPALQATTRLPFAAARGPIRSSSARSSLLSTGLAMKSSMPASMHAARSCGVAPALSATIGRRVTRMPRNAGGCGYLPEIAHFASGTSLIGAGEQSIGLPFSATHPFVSANRIAIRIPAGDRQDLVGVVHQAPPRIRGRASPSAP